MYFDIKNAEAMPGVFVLSKPAGKTLRDAPHITSSAGISFINCADSKNPLRQNDLPQGVVSFTTELMLGKAAASCAKPPYCLCRMSATACFQPLSRASRRVLSIWGRYSCLPP